MCAAINIWCGLRYCTEVRFATFLSGRFITAIVHRKFTGKETSKTHLCALNKPRHICNCLTFSIVIFVNR